jgi:hypothetical protein
MNLEVNTRGNGACPLCVNNDDCRFKKSLKQSLDDYNGLEMEIVIYECSQFREKL